MYRYFEKDKKEQIYKEIRNVFIMKYREVKERSLSLKLIESIEKYEEKMNEKMKLPMSYIIATVLPLPILLYNLYAGFKKRKAIKEIYRNINYNYGAIAGVDLEEIKVKLMKEKINKNIKLSMYSGLLSFIYYKILS